MITRLFSLLLLALFVFPGCSKKKEPAPALPVDVPSLTFTLEGKTYTSAGNCWEGTYVTGDNMTIYGEKLAVSLSGRTFPGTLYIYYEKPFRATAFNPPYARLLETDANGGQVRDWYFTVNGTGGIVSKSGDPLRWNGTFSSSNAAVGTMQCSYSNVKPYR